MDNPRINQGKMEVKQTPKSTPEPASTAPQTSQTYNFRGGFPSGITSPRPDSTQAEPKVPVQLKEASSAGDRQAPTTSRVFDQPRSKQSGRSQEYGKSKTFYPSARAEYREPPRQRPQTHSVRPQVFNSQRPQVSYSQRPQVFNSQRPPSHKSPQLSFPNHQSPSSQIRHGWKKEFEGHGRSRYQEKQKNEGDLARPSRPGGAKNTIPHQQITYSKPPLREFRVPLQQQPFSRDDLDNRNIISPQLSSQIPTKIYKLLTNPITSLASGSRPRNPYFTETLFPFYSDLFQKLVDDPQSTKNSKKYSSFNGLNLTNQLEEFFRAQALAEEELRDRWQLILDISFILRQEYPNCELYPFGSILTGLGDFRSDIDIYVDLLGDSTSNNPNEKNRKLPSHASLDSTRKIIMNSNCPHTTAQFANFLVPVTNAKVPILKLTHSLTSINCDLSFENRLSVQNTKLLCFYMNMDERILKFTVLIRYWAKFHNLTGSNAIKNYALTLLVLVYLCRKSLVPTVHQLQKLKAEEREYLNLPSNPNEIDGWDASFCDNSKRIAERFQPQPYPGENASSTPSISNVLIKMAVEFFTMYANLDFSTVVVTPLTGEFLSRTKFMPGCERLPKSLKRYTDWAKGQPLSRRLNTDAYLCVQDPFLLSYNVGGVTPQSILLKFQIACAKTAEILSEAGHLDSFLDVFIPLPNHVGEKKFMRVYKTESRMEDLKSEIKAAIKKNYYMDNEIDEKSSGSTTSLAQPMPQKSNYVVLPPHLIHLDPFMEEKCLKQMDKKARWETFIVLPLDQQFEAIFMAELTLSKIQNHPKIDVMDNLCELWRGFTLDFMANFFVKGLKLELLRRKNAESQSTSELPINNGRRPSEGGQPRWKLKQLSKKEEQILGPTSKTPREIDLLLRKLLGLPTVRPPIQYELLRFEVTYPFWESRPTILKKMTDELPAEVEGIRVPVLPEKEGKENKQDKKKYKKNVTDQQQDVVKPKPNVRFFSDPVIVQGLVSTEIMLEYQNIAKKDEKPFCTFSFNMLVKLDMSSIHSRPELIVLFEKDSVSKKSKKDYDQAIRSISYILDEDLPNYLIYRLAKMLDLKCRPAPVVAVASSSGTPANSTSTAKEVSVSTSKAASSEPVDKHDENEEKVAQESSNAGEKKKLRTKTPSHKPAQLSFPNHQSPSTQIKHGSKKEFEGHGRSRVGNQEKPKNEDLVRPGAKNTIPQQQITYAEPPSRVLRVPLQQQPFSRYDLDNRNIISPQLSSQIPTKIYKLLTNPITSLASGSRPHNPYFTETLFPFYCELFQKLADDPQSTKNSKKYSSFNGLNLTNQLEEFFRAQALAEEELRDRWQLILDISFILRQEYPNCELYPFGSILTGLGDFRSDIDIYVDLLGDSTSNNPNEKNRKLSSHASLDSTRKIIKKSRCPHTTKRFTNFLVPVTNAKVPILKLTHSQTRINCDLSFENRLSVQNTKLLRFYMNMDERILKFTVLIRYWAKFHNLTGSNAIKNYALTLLVLVYLCRKSLVPTVHQLQVLKAEEREYLNLPSNPNEIDGWDASFCDNSKRIAERFQSQPYPGENASSTPSISNVLIKMAVEFFTMYANLDFSTVVVTPLTGEFLSRTKFIPGCERLPKSLKRYTDWAIGQPLSRRLNTDAYLCVQDPFLLSYNVGSVTPQSILLMFQIACAKTAQFLADAGQLESLLDLFIPLPNHVGDKKFMRVYKTESRMEDLKSEIKAAIKKNYFMDNEIDEKSSGSTTSLAQPMPQKSNYVVLPPHLIHLDPFMEEKCLKQMDKKARWETFIVLPLDQQFEAIFMAELTVCNIQNHSKIDVMDSLCELWRGFTLDFMANFFVKGLKLELLRRRNAESQSTSELPINNGRRPSEGGQPRWKPKPLSKKEEEILGPTSKTPREIDLLLRKILGLPTVRPPIQYELLRFEVTYPFWESRPTILKKMTDELPAEVEGIRVPVLPEKEKGQDKKKNKKSVADQQQDVVKLKPNVRFFSDPVIVQGLVSTEIMLEYQNIAKKDEKPFCTFSFNMLVKLDMSSIHSRPELIVLFEKDSVSKKSKKDYDQAIRSISYILDEDLPNYLIYRLAKMLDLKCRPAPVVAVASTSGTPANSTSTAEEVSVSTSKAASSEPVDKHDENEEKVAQESSNAEEKKKLRTKSEEDLLIPSSSSCDSLSSSTSSSSTSTDVEEEGEGVEERDGNVNESEATDTLN